MSSVLTKPYLAVRTENRSVSDCYFIAKTHQDSVFKKFKLSLNAAYLLRSDFQHTHNKIHSPCLVKDRVQKSF